MALMVGFRELYRRRLCLKLKVISFTFQIPVQRCTVPIIYLGLKAEASPSTGVMTDQRVVKHEAAEEPVPLQDVPVTFPASLCYD